MQAPQEPNVLSESSKTKEAVQMNIDDAVEDVRKASYWFFGIAALSLINSFLISKGQYFILGLAMTQLIDSIVIVATGDVNYFISFIAPAVFILIGYFGARLQRWAFITGGTLYIIDAVLYIFFQEWFAFGFHLFILYKLYQGYRTISEYEALSKEMNQNTI